MMHMCIHYVYKHSSIAFCHVSIVRGKVILCKECVFVAGRVVGGHYESSYMYNINVLFANSEIQRNVLGTHHTK